MNIFLDITLDCISYISQKPLLLVKIELSSS